MTAAPTFDPFKALRALVEGKVRFVIIGGIAGRLWGSPTVTNDLDICYAHDAVNLRRLAAVLSALHARLRGVDADVKFEIDERALALGDHFTMVTDAGNLDVLATPAGTRGFDQLMRTAEKVDLDGLSVYVASLEDLIDMKRAAGRLKDRIELEVLGALLEERGSAGL
jgi:hypothetical protein